MIYSSLLKSRHRQSCGPWIKVDSTNLVIFLSFFGIFVAYLVRICPSQAMLPMSEHYQWTETQQGYLFASFYYGYITTQIPGGWLSQTFGSKYVIFFGVFGSALLNALTPMAAHSFPLLMMLRGLTGFVQGVFWPSCLHLLSCWVDIKHRSLAVSLVLSGQHLGTAAIQGGFPRLDALYGWRMPFYLIGFIGAIWSGLWIAFLQNRPKGPRSSLIHIVDPENDAFKSDQSSPANSERNSTDAFLPVHAATASATDATTVAHAASPSSALLSSAKGPVYDNHFLSTSIPFPLPFPTGRALNEGFEDGDDDGECLIKTDGLLMMNGHFADENSYNGNTGIFHSHDHPHDSDDEPTVYFRRSVSESSFHDSDHMENLESAPSLVLPSLEEELPWWAIFKYKSVWAYFTLIFCYNWSFYLLVSYLPKYLNYVLGYSAQTAGNLAVAAYLGLYLTILVGGRATGYFIAHGYRVTFVRKIGVTIGLLPSAILIFVTYWVPSSQSIAILFIVAVALTGIAHSTFAPNPMDLVPRAPAMIASFGNIIGTVPGFVSSMIAGWILEKGHCSSHFPVEDSCAESWHVLFRVCIGIYLFGWVIWMSCSSGTPLIERHKQSRKKKARRQLHRVA